MNKTSSVVRIAGIFKQLADLRSNDRLKMIDAWSKILAPGESRKLSEDEIVPLLGLLRSQIDDAKALFQGTNNAAAVASPHIETAMRLTSVTSLRVELDSQRKGLVSQEFILCWRLAAELLPRTEEQPSVEDWKEFLDLLKQLEQAISDDIPTGLRAFIERQVKALREAVTRSSIAGAGPVREAMERGLGEMVTQREELVTAAQTDPEKSSGVISKLFNAWKQGAVVADQVDKYAKATAAVGKLYAKALPFLQRTIETISDLKQD